MKRVDNEMNEGEGVAAEHLSSHDVAAYLDGTLEAKAKTEVQDHLAECEECRAEVSQLAELLHAGARRRRWRVAVPAAAAAAAVFLLAGPFARDSAEPGSTVRGPGASADREAVPIVQVLSPAPQAELGRDELVFSWESVGPDAIYRLTLTDERGDPVWTSETSETFLEPPSDLSMEPGATHFWYLDALLPDGGSHTTDVRSFRILP